MERIKIEHTRKIAEYVSKELQRDVTVVGRNGYFVVELDDGRRQLKSGTLRECDTFVRGMYEALRID